LQNRAQLTPLDKLECGAAQTAFGIGKMIEQLNCVRTRQSRYNRNLAFEPLDDSVKIVARSGRPYDLQRDVATEPRVDCAVDDRESAFAQDADDLVALGELVADLRELHAVRVAQTAGLPTRLHSP